MAKYKVEGKKVVLWGSGSKAVSFLSALDVNNEIEYVVDINPNRQNTYLAMTGQQIVSPMFLIDYKPDVVIVSNEIYREEIYRDLLKLNINPIIPYKDTSINLINQGKTFSDEV